MARTNLRGITRNVKFIKNNKKLNWNKLILSSLLSGIYKNSVFMGKRPRWCNWLVGKNKF
jgi:hypothetical protein